MSFIAQVAKTVAVHIVADYLTEPAKKVIDTAVKEGTKLQKKFNKMRAKKTAPPTKPAAPVTDVEEATELTPAQLEINAMKNQRKHRKV